MWTNGDPQQKSTDKILYQCYKILFLVPLALSVPPIDPPFVSVFCAAKTKQGEGALAHHNCKSLSDKDKGGRGAITRVEREEQFERGRVRSDNWNLGRGTIREMKFRQRDDQRRIFMKRVDQRNGIYGEGR
jgi:hypothetical protein